MHRYHNIAIITLIAALGPLTASGANRRLNYEELAASADKVVLGTVGIKSSHWGEDSRIYTDIVVSPDVTIKGAEESAVVVRVLGGTVGDTTMSVSDGPEFSEGESRVLFLKRENDHFTVTGRSAGSIASSSLEAGEALDGAFRQVERGAGRRLAHQRSVSQMFLSRAAATTNAAQVGCYSTDGAKWATTSATYKIGASIPSGWAPSIDASTATWNGVAAGFRLVNDAASVNELSYLDLVAKYGSSYSNTFAVTTTWSSNSTGRISKATIEINTKWTWSTSGETNKADVQNILTHEFGHWMRLLDIYSPTSCGEVTMWGNAALGETKKRTLEQPDLDGFLGLYSGSGTGGTTVGTPSLASPAHGATGVSTTPALTWSAAANATSYDVYLGLTASASLVATVTGTAYQPGTLTAGTTYYWRVVAKGSSGSAASSTFSFTVVGGTGGTTAGPILISPANGATGVSLSPVMQWSAVTGATAYDIYIGTTPAPTRIGSVRGTSVTVSGFRAGTVYYWKVVARTPSGSFSSSVGSFQTN